MQRYERSTGFIGSTIAALIVYVTALLTLWIEDESIAAENALMENLQACTLAIAAGLLLFPLVQSESAFGRFASWSLALVLVSMLLREVDVEHLGLPAWLTWWGSGTGRNLWLGCCFAGTALLLAVRWQVWSGPLRNFAFSTTGLLVSFGCGLYAASFPFDKHLSGFTAPTDQFCEEVAECGATLVFLLASGWTVFAPRSAIRQPYRGHDWIELAEHDERATVALRKSA